MTAEFWTTVLPALVNVAAAVAVIVVVVIFLQYIERRDKALTEAVNKLTDKIQALENKFTTHEAAEMEILREFVDTQRTQPRGGLR
jgi:low affinity Fe/Cu permease